ncbi:hypothetical protein AVEN_97870-1 [Araneus ventricosus]|uniref:Uncharacterized protein n=1 Tax=Araneus ventricosus TaxID=182803 RepID=A0A4Y2F5P9_ARAVE|nr:hypothetical protein AVEN_97870-1 [Araneus ventricosus]
MRSKDHLCRILVQAHLTTSDGKHGVATSLLSTSIRLDIWIKVPISISHSHESSSMEHMEVSMSTQRDSNPNHDSASSTTVFFSYVILVPSGVLLSPYQHPT